MNHRALSLSFLLCAALAPAFSATVKEVRADFKAIDEGIIAARIAANMVANDKRAAFVAKLKLDVVDCTEPADPTRSQAEKASLAKHFNYLNGRLRELGYDGVEQNQWDQYLNLYQVYVGPLPSVSGANEKAPKNETPEKAAEPAKKRPITFTLSESRKTE